MSVPNPLLVPPQRAPLAGSALCTNEWYVFFQRTLDYLQATGVDPSVIADIEARLAALEAAGGADFLLQGLLSVEVAGTPAGGVVQLSLVADEATPDDTHYYGTSPTGQKGWHAVADAVAGEDSVVQDVGLDGVSTFHLDGDAPAPGALFGYGTNIAGAKGWYRPALFESTGLLAWSAPYLRINLSDPTKFDVGAAVVGYTDYDTNPVGPTRAYAIYGPTLANAVPSLANIATWVGIQTPGLTLVMQSTAFTPAQRRHIVQLGAVISNGTQLIAVNNLPVVLRAGINQVGDFMRAVGPINNGNLVGPNGANLQINKGAGSVFKEGANFANNPDDPHNLPLPSLTAANFNYRTSTGVQAATTNTINVTQYESPLGTLATVPNNRFTVQRIYVFTSNLLRIQYGQTVYQTMADAEAAIATQPFATEANIAENGVLLAFLILEKSATSLNSAAQAKFIPADKFGGVVGSGGTSITNTDALPEGVVNLYFTDERAQDAIGNNLLDTATINLAYNDTTGQISADADPSGVVLIAGTQTVTGPKRFNAPVALFDIPNATDGLLLVNANSVANPVPAIEAYADNGTTQANISATSFGVNGGGVFHGRMANGTKASPTPVLKDQIYAGYGGRPFASGIGFTSSSPVSTHWVATENQTSGALGGYFRVLTTPKGSAARQSRLVVTDAGTTWSHDTAAYDESSNSQYAFLSGWTGFLSSAVNQNARLVAVSYGPGGSSAVASLNLATTRGTPSAPAPLQSGDRMSAIAFTTYNGGAWVAPSAIFCEATENHTATANGSSFFLEVTPKGSLSRIVGLRIEDDGRLWGSAIHNNAGPVTGTANQYIASGTWTPTLTNMTNIAASSASVCQWSRVGNVVNFSGRVTIDPTATGLIQLGLSLPISSNFTAVEQAGGTGASNNEFVRIYADATNDRLMVESIIKADVAAAGFHFSGSYLIA